MYLQLGEVVLPVAIGHQDHWQTRAWRLCSRHGKAHRHIRCPSSTCADEARPECTARRPYLPRVCHPGPDTPILLTCNDMPDVAHVLGLSQRNEIETVVDVARPKRVRNSTISKCHHPIDREVVCSDLSLSKVCRSIFQLMRCRLSKPRERSPVK
jgi:hypothetical protein